MSPITMSDPYIYPDTTILINRYGLRDGVTLDAVERLKVSQRMREPIPHGTFDLTHLCNIHRHLFQDIYEWAGEIRTVQISKGGKWFLPSDRLHMGMEDVHRTLIACDYLRGKAADEFCSKAAQIMGDVNYIHPFREGNGRTQLMYLEQLAEKAGHPINIYEFSRESWIPASIASHDGNAILMQDAIKAALR